ncbi:hypothetical protein FOWG_07806 [Fusarium oxysporum f. sp. lycopersici MN25]|nr:hypothetical protein FOWG_07806 [Fusarium oxysporum f. sp. lycopersici MN25]
MIPPKGQQKKKKKKKKTIFKKTHGHDFNCFVGALSRWSAWKLWNAPGTLSRPQPGLSCRANESQSADPSYRNVD